MNRKVLFGGLAFGLVGVGLAVIGAPAAKPKPGGGKPTGGLQLGGSGLSTTGVGKPPPSDAFYWSGDCKPEIKSESKAFAWAQELGKAAPPGDAAQLLEFGARAGLGKCWPPPADLAVWQPFLAPLFRITRAYLQGLVAGGQLSAAAAQGILEDGRKDLIARGVSEAELPFYLYDKP